MYGFCRLGFRPAPSAGAACVGERRRDDDEEEREEDRDAAEHGDDPGNEIARCGG